MKVGLSACSNGHMPEWEGQITELKEVFKSMDIDSVCVPHIIRTAMISAELMRRELLIL